MSDAVDKADAWDAASRSWKIGYERGYREALEEAARVAERLVHPKLCHCEKIVVAIRALKEKE